MEILSDYNPAWPLAFEAEKRRILEALGDRIVAIEHIGSTSVPGLRAKPIIDILVAVDSLDSVQAFVDPLRELGYEYRPDNKEIIPDTEYFRRGPPGSNTHHLRIVKTDSPLWDEYILFRNHLRSHAEACREYEQLKTVAYETYGKYLPIETKKKFIESILGRTGNVPSRAFSD